jgi:AbrB family looped-hinge helix DNA binding protein
MKIGSFTTTNDKGQIVIPKDIRDTLGIDSHVTLNITVAGDGIYIHPVEEFITKAETESSYLQLLEKTRGTWVEEDWDELRQTKSKTELNASKSRKTSW